MMEMPRLIPRSQRVRTAAREKDLKLLLLVVVFLTLTDPLRTQPWSQDRRNQTKSNSFNILQFDISMRFETCTSHVCLVYNLTPHANDDTPTPA